MITIISDNRIQVITNMRAENKMIGGESCQGAESLEAIKDYMCSETSKK